MRYPACVFVVAWILLTAPAQAQRRNSDASKGRLARVRGTYEGELNSYKSRVRVVVDDSRPDDCGIAEFSGWGCRGPISNCALSGRGLSFDILLFESDGTKCKRLPSVDGVIGSGLIGLQLELWAGGRIKLATAQITHDEKVASLPPLPARRSAVPACDPSAKAELDLNAEWSYHETAGLVFVEQQGTCVTLTVPSADSDPSYEATGTLQGERLLLKWREVGGKATGEAAMKAQPHQLTVLAAPGASRWLPMALTRLHDLSALHLAKTLLASVRGAAGKRDPERAHAVLQAVHFILETDAPAAPARGQDALRDPRVRETMATVTSIRKGLPPPRARDTDLIVRGIQVLLETGQQARERGDRKVTLDCIAVASKAVRKLRDPKLTIPLSLRISGLHPDTPYLVRTAAQHTDEAQAQRSEALKRCLDTIAGANVAAAEKTCGEEDRLLAKLAPDATDIAASSRGEMHGRDIAARDQMKATESLGESAVLTSLSKRFEALDVLSRQPGVRAPIRERAAKWAERILGELAVRFGGASAFRDFPTALRALQTNDDVRAFMTAPRDIQQLGQMYRQSGFGVLFSSGESIEDKATSFAVRSGRGRELALYLLSQRKGKGHAIEGAIAERVRERAGADYELLRAKRGQLSALHLSKRGLGEVPERTREALRAEIEAIETRLATSAQDEPLTPIRSDQPDKEWVDATAARLPADGALLSYHRFQSVAASGPEAHYAAFVVRGSPRRIAVADLGPAATLDGAIDALLASLHKREPLAATQARAAALHDLLLRPLDASLQGATRLWVSPDAQIARVPLAALHDGRDWLVERYEIQVVEAAPLSTRPRAIEPSGSVVVVANPERSDTLYVAPDLDPKRYADLPGAQEETSVLEAAFPKRVSSFAGANAVESVLYDVDGPAILHIAGHGIYLAASADGGSGRGMTVSTKPAAPLTRAALHGWLEAMLLLARPAASLDAALVDGLDGFATAYELSTINLQGTQLVVLSACQSGLGAIGNWSGVNSVQQAFHIAGADDVLATLWNIDDQATVRFVRVLYRELAQGVAPAAAVRTAMRSQLKEDPDPYLWAPFMLSTRSTQSY